LSAKINVQRTDNDAGMVGLLVMQADEVFAVESENRSVLARRKGQDFGIRHCLLGLIHFENR